MTIWKAKISIIIRKLSSSFSTWLFVKPISWILNTNDLNFPAIVSHDSLLHNNFLNSHVTNPNPNPNPNPNLGTGTLKMFIFFINLLRKWDKLYPLLYYLGGTGTLKNEEEKKTHPYIPTLTYP